MAITAMSILSIKSFIAGRLIIMMIALIREADHDLYVATEYVRYFTYDEQQFDKLKSKCTNDLKATMKKE